MGSFASPLAFPLGGDVDATSTFWGPHFPDRRSSKFISPATQATLALVTVAAGGALDLVSVRARTSGIVGNTYTISFSNDSLSTTGEIDETTPDTIIRYVGGITTLADLFVLFSASSDLEMIGTWTPTDVLLPDDDEFLPVNLSGGADAAAHISSFWGPHFPDKFVEVADVPGVGPDTVATLLLDLESGLKIIYQFDTSISRWYSGREQRSSNLDSPTMKIVGSAILSDEFSLSIRTILQRHAALGSPFLLGLPFEEISIFSNSESETVNALTSLSDWTIIGQKVLVREPGGDAVVEDVIQDVTPSTVVLSSGHVQNRRGGRLMPAIPVFLDPQQGFSKYPGRDDVFIWQIQARAVLFGYVSAPIPAELSLADPNTRSGVLETAFLRAVTAGEAGNSRQVEFRDDSLSLTGELDESAPNLTIFKYVGGITTVGDLETSLNASDFVRLRGEYDEADVLVDADDVMPPTFMSGGADEILAERGVGASVAIFGSVPIWNRFIRMDGTSPETMQSLAQVLDLGASPFSVGCADDPQWGRMISITRNSQAEFQWLIKFLFTISGSFQSFWRPTWMEDLEPAGDAVSSGLTGILIISTDVGNPSFWFTKRTMLQVVMETGDVYYVRTTGILDNGDGTTTIDVIGDPGETDSPDGPVLIISWMERCRIENDASIEIVFNGPQFSMETLVRVVQE